MRWDKLDMKSCLKTQKQSVFWNRISCPACFRVCSPTADFSGCFSLQFLSCSLILVWMLHFVDPIYTWPQLQGIRYTPAVVRGSFLSFDDYNICCVFVVGLNTVVGCVISKVSPCSPWPHWCMAEILHLWVAVFLLHFGVIFSDWWLLWFHSWNSELPVGPNSNDWECWKIELYSSDLHGLPVFWLCLFLLWVVVGVFMEVPVCVGGFFCRPCVPIGQVYVWPWQLRRGVVPLFVLFYFSIYLYYLYNIYIPPCILWSSGRL